MKVLPTKYNGVTYRSRTEALAAWSDFLRARERYDEQRTRDAEEAMVTAYRGFCVAFAGEGEADELVAALRRTVDRERATL